MTRTFSCRAEVVQVVVNTASNVPLKLRLVDCVVLLSDPIIVHLSTMKINAKLIYLQKFISLPLPRRVAAARLAQRRWLWCPCDGRSAPHSSTPQ